MSGGPEHGEAGQGEAARGHPLSSLRVRLLLLVLIAVLPAAGLILRAGLEQRRHDIRVAEDEVMRLTRLAAARHEEAIAEGRQLLRVLAQLPPVRRRDGAGCSALFAVLVRDYSHFANMVASDAEGKLFCSALPTPGPVNVADRSYFVRARETRDFAVGEYQIGRITGKAVLGLAQPVLDPAGRFQGVVFAALDLTWLNQLAARAELPPDSSLTVLDRQGTVLARFPDPDRWVGQAPAEARLVRTILAERSGVRQLPGLEGVSRLYAFVPLGEERDPAAYVSVGIPVEPLLASANRGLIRNLILLGLVAAVAFAAAWIGGDLFVLRQVRALVGATKRLSAGDLGARTGLAEAQGEMGEMARAFDGMAGALERREAERDRTLAELRMRTRQLEAVQTIAREITREFNLSTLLNLVVERAMDLVDGASGIIALWDETRQVLLPRAWRGLGAWVGDLQWRLGEAVIGRVAQRREGLIVSDYRAWPHADPLALERTAITAVQAEPLLGGDRLVGVITLNREAGGCPFTEEDRQALALFAAQAAIAIENARLVQSAEEHARELETLHEIGQAIAGHLALSKVLEAVVEGTMRLLDNPFAQIVLWDEESQRLRFGAAKGPEAERVGQQVFEVGRGINGTVALTRRPMVLDDYQRSPYVVPECFDVVATITVPILFGDRLLGVLHSHTTTPGCRFSPDDLRCLQRLAAQAAIAIENARLYEELRLAAKHLEARVEDRTRELQEVNRQLAEASQHKSDFLANMSHELRTPLNSILGFAQILLERPGELPAEKQTRYLSHIYNSGQHLLRLISDILDLSKVEAGKIVLEPELLPVLQTLEDILVIARGLATKKGQTIHAEIEADLPPLCADAVRFKQILFNLLSNAVKFTPEGGTITVRARPVIAEEHGSGGAEGRWPPPPAPRPLRRPWRSPSRTRAWGFGRRTSPSSSRSSSSSRRRAPSATRALASASPSRNAWWSCTAAGSGPHRRGKGGGPLSRCCCRFSHRRLRAGSRVQTEEGRS